MILRHAISTKKEILKELREKGYEAYLIGTVDSKKMQLEAGVSFYTNGLDDFGDFPYVYGSLIISLWHGVGFKKIYGTDDGIKKNKIIKGIAAIKNMLFSYVYSNVLCTTSIYSKNMFKNFQWIKDIDNTKEFDIKGKFISNEKRNE